MRFKPNDTQAEMLVALNSSYHFESLPQPRPSPKEDPPTPLIRCTIIDIKHNESYASGMGVTEEAAFLEAIQVAHSADRPQTAAEIAAERDALKAQLDHLKSKQGGGAGAQHFQPPRKPRKINPNDKRLKANRPPEPVAPVEQPAVP